MKPLEKWMKKENLGVLLLVGLLLLVIALPVRRNEENTGTEETDAETDQGLPAQDWQTKMENRLIQVLEQVQGVGKAEVFLTCEGTQEKVVEKDASSGQENVTEADSQGGTRSTVSKNLEETTVYASGEDTEGSPYVSKELSPRIEGVLVVAEGGGRAEIKQDITEAVEALFGIESHKIRIMKKQEP